jgi:hypothetical protein
MKIFDANITFRFDIKEAYNLIKSLYVIYVNLIPKIICYALYLLLNSREITVWNNNKITVKQQWKQLKRYFLSFSLASMH